MRTVLILLLKKWCQTHKLLLQSSLKKKCSKEKSLQLQKNDQKWKKIQQLKKQLEMSVRVWDAVCDVFFNIEEYTNGDVDYIKILFGEMLHI